MDLFKYSFKLFPHLPAEALADALETAIQARVLDMRASPYDLSSFAAADTGFDLSPIRIETEQGRREYQRLQVQVARRAAPVRRRLLRHYEAALAACDGDASAAAPPAPACPKL